MIRSIVFSGLHSLNFSDIRHNVVRIPEVISRVKMAQEITNNLGESACFSEDFFTTLTSDNSVYNKNIKLKSVLNCIVQLGLYDRYIKKFGRPDFLLGDINGESPLNVVIGESTFESLFQKDGVQELAILKLSNEPFLSGVKMSLHQAFRFQEDSFLAVDDSKKELGLLVRDLIEEHQVRQIIDIGPGSGWAKANSFDYSLYDIQVLESIDMDPMLSWFWPYVRNQNADLDMAN